MLAGQTCKTQMPNTLNVKFQVILKADTTVYLFIAPNLSDFSCVYCCCTLHSDVCNNGRSGSDVLSLLSYGRICTYRNLLTRAEIPHHTPRPPFPPAHPPFCWSGISYAEKWFAVYFLMRRGDMGICSLNWWKQTLKRACHSRRQQSEYLQKHTSRHAPFPSHLS